MKFDYFEKIANILKSLPKYLENLSGRSRLRIFKAIVALLMGSLATYYLSYRFFDQPIKVRVGDIANFDIRVPHDIVYIQPIETQQERDRARKQVLRVFDRDQSLLSNGVKQLNLLFHHIESTDRKFGLTIRENMDEAIFDLKQNIAGSQQIKNSSLEILLLYNRSNLLSSKTIELYVSLMDQPILVDKKKIENTNENIIIRTINTEETVPEQTKNLKDIMDLLEVQNKIYDLSRDRFPTLTRGKLNAIIEVVSQLLRPNLFYNESETFRRMENVVRNVKPVKGLLKKGQVVVRYGEPVTQDKYEKILIMNRYQARGNIAKVIGLFLLIIAMGSLVVSFFQRYTRLRFSEAKDVAIVGLLFFVIITIIFLISRIDGIFHPENIFALYVPVAFLTISLSLLYDEKVAIGGGLFISVYILLASNNEDIASFYVAFATTMLGSFTSNKVKKRSDFLRIGFYIALSNIAIVLIIALFQGFPTNIIFKLIIIAFLNGIGASIMAFGLIPVLESLFDITTDFKLLELTDLSSPMLKMLLFKAPGTYQHSIAVASLAEKACEEIHANPLLVKVGIYYHDIGKSKRAEFFIENQAPGTKNPHNALSAFESSQIIIEHVKHGLELVDANGLPKILKDFITGHHGRTVIKYFYHKALEEASDPSKVNKEDFTYPGPNPKSKESGIAMLADSIEAASRVMQPPITIQAIKELVKKIINSKVSDGLLNNCELTMKDLNVAGDSFVSTLVGIYHSRIEYPDEKKTKKLEEQKNNLTKKKTV